MISKIIQWFKRQNQQERNKQEMVHYLRSEFFLTENQAKFIVNKPDLLEKFLKY